MPGASMTRSVMGLRERPVVLAPEGEHISRGDDAIRAAEMVAAKKPGQRHVVPVRRNVYKQPAPENGKRGGRLVFGTILENIKSFFQKEEELEHEPKQAPDAAVELFEKPLAWEQSHRIVAHSLKGEPSPQPKLPFTSEQLRRRLQEAPPGPVTRAEGNGPVESQRPAPAAPEPKEDISSQIVEFEQAISAIPGEDGSSIPLSSAKERSRAAPGHPSSYFRKAALQDGLAPEELLARMKEHHAQRLARERHDETVRGMEQELARLMAELQGLERDWAAKQEEIEAARERVAELEEAILAKGGELQEALARMKEQEARSPPEAGPADDARPQEPIPAAPSEHGPSPDDAVPSQDNAAGVTAGTQPSEPSAAGPREPMGVPPKPEAVAEEASRRAIAPEQRFFLADGSALSSLAELKDALLRMDDRVFYGHVTPERNDFAAWIAGVFKDEALAERVRHVRTKYELAGLL